MALAACKQFATLYPPTATNAMFEPVNEIYARFVGELIAEGLVDASLRTSSGLVTPSKVGGELTLRYVHCRTTTAQCPSLIESSTRYAGLAEYDVEVSSSNEEEGVIRVHPPPTSEEITWSCLSPVSVTATFDHETSTVKIHTRRRTLSPLLTKKKDVDDGEAISFYEPPPLVEPSIHVEPARAVARLVEVMVSSFCTM